MTELIPVDGSCCLLPADAVSPEHKNRTPSDSKLKVLVSGGGHCGLLGPHG